MKTHLFDNGRDMGGRRSAATANHIQPPLGGKLPYKSRHLRGGLVVAAKGIRQARVRVAADKAVGDLRKLLDVGPHLGGTQRTIDAHGEWLAMAHGIPEGLDGLS